mmetsp:Transcript_9120/g.35602  ORF Transcript_9120/g.35602 Transcript_9120/m.35602 type:complete len:229 (+) Transcript_9120:788-1474(+)
MHRMKRLKGMDSKRLRMDAKRLKSRRGLRERGMVRETPKRSRCTRCCRCRGVFSATWTSSRSGGGFSVGRGSRWAPSSAFCSCDGTTRGFGSGRSAPRTPRTPRFFSKTDPATTTTTTRLRMGNNAARNARYPRWKRRGKPSSTTSHPSHRSKRATTHHKINTQTRANRRPNAAAGWCGSITSRAERSEGRCASGPPSCPWTASSSAGTPACAWWREKRARATSSCVG